MGGHYLAQKGKAKKADCANSELVSLGPREQQHGSTELIILSIMRPEKDRKRSILSPLAGFYNFDQLCIHFRIALQHFTASWLSIWFGGQTQIVGFPEQHFTRAPGHLSRLPVHALHSPTKAAEKIWLRPHYHCFSVILLFYLFGLGEKLHVLTVLTPLFRI